MSNFSILYFCALRWTTLHQITLYSTPLHYTTLHQTTLHQAAHYTKPHYTKPHYAKPYTSLHSVTLHLTTLQVQRTASLQYTTLHYTQLILYYIALPSTDLCPSSPDGSDQVTTPGSTATQWHASQMEPQTVGCLDPGGAVVRTCRNSTPPSRYPYLIIVRSAIPDPWPCLPIQSQAYHA